jgi:hypothetical protein
VIPPFKFTVIDDEGYEVEHEVPARYEVCERCEGSGKHDHPAFSNGITSSEWAEWDYDERESYLRGRYDVTCEECKGQRVVLHPDEDRCTPEQKQALEEYYRVCAEEAQERRWERWRASHGIEY